MKIHIILLLATIINEISTEDTNYVSSCLVGSVSGVNYRNVIYNNCACGMENICLRKCFAEDEIICMKNGVYRFCATTTEEMRKVLNRTEKCLIGMLNSSDSKLHYTENVTDIKYNFYIQKNGILVSPRDKMYSRERYCVDKHKNIIVCTEEPLDVEEPFQISQFVLKMTIAGKLTSVVFLMFTWLVFLLVPERNFHRIALMYHFFTLMLVYAFAAGSHFTSFDFYNFCTVFGFPIMYFMMITKLWLNVICIDIWLTFSCLQNFYEQRIKHKLFVIAFLYVFGLSTLIMLIILFDNPYSNETMNRTTRLGAALCFEVNDFVIFYIYFGFLHLIDIINLVLFVLIIIDIRRIKKEISFARNQKHSKKADDSLIMSLKLFLVMGFHPVMLSKSIALIIKLVGKEISAEINGNIRNFIYVLNAFFGLLTGLIFICQRNIWTSVKKRLRCTIISNTAIEMSASSTRMSSTSGKSSKEDLKGIENIAADVP